MNKERWRRVPGFEHYLVSSQGRLYNTGAPVPRSGSLPDWEDGKCHRGTQPHELRPKERFMKIFLHRGRPHTMLRRDRKSFNLPVIDLMASAFLGEIPEGYEIEVKNGVFTDTRLENLYVKAAESKWVKRGRAQRRNWEAAYLSDVLELHAQGLSTRKIAARLGCSKSAVWAAVRR